MPKHAYANSTQKKKKKKKNKEKRKKRKGNDGTQNLLVINAGHECWSI